MSPRRYDMSRRRAAVEETRRRILGATLELHAAQGILATSWEDIAQRAGVSPATVYRHFPSLDELVPACGALSLELLALPGGEDARSLFADVAGGPARLRVLLGAAYAIYERGGDVIVAVRRDRERHELAPVAEAHELIERTLDGLVREALAPLDASEESRRLVRAVTDFDTWRALRRQRITGEAAVEAGQRLAEAALGS